MASPLGIYILEEPGNRRQLGVSKRNATKTIALQEYAHNEDTQADSSTLPEVLPPSQRSQYSIWVITVRSFR